MKSKFSKQISNFLDVSGLRPGSSAPLSGAVDKIMDAFKTVFAVAPAMQPLRAVTKAPRMPESRIASLKSVPRFRPGKPRNIWE